MKSDDQRPDLMTLFTPFDGANRSHRFDQLEWSAPVEGVSVARIPASMIDGRTRGTAGFIARTDPKRKGGQADRIMWVGNIRVKVAAENFKTIAIYHVGTGGPLFPTHDRAYAAAHAWRWGRNGAEQTALDV